MHLLGFDLGKFELCVLKQYLQEEGSKGNQGDKEVCGEGNGDKGCESGCEAEQADLEQRYQRSS